MVERARWIVALGVKLACGKAGQQAQALIDGLHREDPEPFLRRRCDDILAKHQVLDVARRNDHPLPAGEAGSAAGVEEALDLLVDATDCLDPAVLVDRARDRERLLDRRLSERRQQREEFGGRGAIAVDPAIGLLEDEAGVKRKRPCLAEAPAEKAGKDQHPFGMQRPAELDLALDIDDFAAAEPDPGGDATGIAKAETAERYHRKPVDLADFFAVGLDADGLAADLLLQAAVDPITTTELRVDRALYFGRCNNLLAGARGNLVGLLQQIDNLAQPRRQPVGIPGKARSPLDHPRDRSAVQREEIVLTYHAGDKPRVKQRRFPRALDTVVEIGGDLEQVLEVVVDSAEQVIERRRTEQHDLNVERDRFGLQRDRARHTKQLFQALDADLAGNECTFQRCPAEISGQQPLRIEQQITAIGTMQCPRREQIEVGDERTEARNVLDPADQRLMGRIVLEYDRGALVGAVVDKDIDLVAPEAVLGDGLLDWGRHRPPWRGRRRLRQKIIGVLFDVALDGVEVLHDFGQVAMAGTQFVHHGCDCSAGGLASELAYRLAMLTLPLRDFLHDSFELALHLLQIVLDLFTLGRWQRFEHFRRQHLAVAPRRES